MGRYRQHAQGRSGPSAFIYTLLGAVLIGCGVMGLSLKGAKVAYEKLWDQLKAQELENSRMEQNVAAMKVEAVTSQAKAEDLETMRAMLQRNVEDTRGRVQEMERTNSQLSQQVAEAEAKAQHSAEQAEANQAQSDDLRSKLDEAERKLIRAEEQLQELRYNEMTQGMGGGTQAGAHLAQADGGAQQASNAARKGAGSLQ